MPSPRRNTDPQPGQSAATPSTRSASLGPSDHRVKSVADECWDLRARNRGKPASMCARCLYYQARTSRRIPPQKRCWQYLKCPQQCTYRAEWLALARKQAGTTQVQKSPAPVGGKQIVNSKGEPRNSHKPVPEERKPASSRISEEGYRKMAQAIRILLRQGG